MQIGKGYPNQIKLKKKKISKVDEMLKDFYHYGAFFIFLMFFIIFFLMNLVFSIFTPTSFLEILKDSFTHTFLAILLVFFLMALYALSIFFSEKKVEIHYNELLVGKKVVPLDSIYRFKRKAIYGRRASKSYSEYLRVYYKKPGGRKALVKINTNVYEAPGLEELEKVFIILAKKRYDEKLEELARDKPINNKICFTKDNKIFIKAKYYDPGSIKYSSRQLKRMTEGSYLVFSDYKEDSFLITVFDQNGFKKIRVTSEKNNIYLRFSADKKKVASAILQEFQMIKDQGLPVRIDWRTYLDLLG